MQSFIYCIFQKYKCCSKMPLKFSSKYWANSGIMFWGCFSQNANHHEITSQWCIFLSLRLGCRCETFNSLHSCSGLHIPLACLSNGQIVQGAQFPNLKFDGQGLVARLLTYQGNAFTWTTPLKGEIHFDILLLTLPITAFG
jgi:hypothetical protein